MTVNKIESQKILSKFTIQYYNKDVLYEQAFTPIEEVVPDISTYDTEHKIYTDALTFLLQGFKYIHEEYQKNLDVLFKRADVLNLSMDISNNPGLLQAALYVFGAEKAKVGKIEYSDYIDALILMQQNNMNAAINMSNYNIDITKVANTSSPQVTNLANIITAFEQYLIDTDNLDFTVANYIVKNAAKVTSAISGLQDMLSKINDSIIPTDSNTTITATTGLVYPTYSSKKVYTKTLEDILRECISCEGRYLGLKEQWKTLTNFKKLAILYYNRLLIALNDILLLKLFISDHLFTNTLCRLIDSIIYMFCLPDLYTIKSLLMYLMNQLKSTFTGLPNFKFSTMFVDIVLSNLIDILYNELLKFQLYMGGTVLCVIQAVESLGYRISMIQNLDEIQKLAQNMMQDLSGYLYKGKRWLDEKIDSLQLEIDRLIQSNAKDNSTYMHNLREINKVRKYLQLISEIIRYYTIIKELSSKDKLTAENLYQRICFGTYVDKPWKKSNIIPLSRNMSGRIYDSDTHTRGRYANDTEPTMPDVDMPNIGGKPQLSDTDILDLDLEYTGIRDTHPQQHIVIDDPTLGDNYFDDRLDPYLDIERPEYQVFQMWRREIDIPFEQEVAQNNEPLLDPQVVVQYNNIKSAVQTLKHYINTQNLGIQVTMPTVSIDISTCIDSAVYSKEQIAQWLNIINSGE